MAVLEDTKTVEQYLTRIQFPGFDANGQHAELPAANLENLQAICRCHRLHVPFENLLFVHHILKGTSRPVDQVSLHKRIVVRKRGGMCQEMNALLLHNLKLLGYSGYAGLACMVFEGPTAELAGSEALGSSQQRLGPASHCILFVHIDSDTYLCDVGAGPKSLAEPVLLRANDDGDSRGPSQQPPPAGWLAAQGEYQQYGMRYRLRCGIKGSTEALSTAAAMAHPERDSVVGYYLQHCIKGVWSDMYWFQLTPAADTALQASSDATFRQHVLFTRHMVVSKVVPGGRVTLFDFVLKTRLQGQPSEERKLGSEEERDAVLQEVFGLDLSPPALPL